MDAPPIHYARTDDGVNIAYWTVGTGAPVVWVNDSVYGHVEREWESIWHSRWYHALSADRRLVGLWEGLGGS